MQANFKSLLLAAAAALALALGTASARAAPPDGDAFEFEMVRSPVLAAFPGCLPNAKARVSIEKNGPVEEMRVRVSGLPPKTDFDFFIIQVPNKPFGMARYQGNGEHNAEVQVLNTSNCPDLPRPLFSVKP